MSIERGDNRQYFESFIPQNTGMGAAVAGALNTVNDVFNKVKQDADVAQFADLQAKQNIELYSASENHKIKWQSDPNSDLAKTEWKQAYRDITSKYDAQVSPFLKRDWTQQQSKVEMNYQATNAEWALNQNRINTQVNLKNSVESNLQLAQRQGLNGDLAGALASFSNSHDVMLKSGASVLGDVTTKELLNSYESDYMTMFVSGLTDKNPAYALKLLNDTRVKGSIKDNEQVAKLRGYAQNKFVSLSKETVINDTAKLILAQSDMGTKLVTGEANYSDLQKFFQSNKNLTPNQRDLLSSMGGYSTYTNYHINRDTGAVEYKKHGSTSGYDFSLSNVAKDKLASLLEIEGGQIFAIDEEELKKLNPKKNKSKDGQRYESDVQTYMNRVSGYQQKVDAYYNAGVIDKGTRQRLNDNYIAPMAEYLNANLKDLDEHQGWWGFGKKLGYNNIKKTFDIEGLEGKELQNTQRELALAQVYYFDNLKKASQDAGKNNIYELENLSSARQQEIYKQASESAISKAKINTINPSYWFERDYPSEYNKINSSLTKKDAKKVATSLANEVRNNLELKPHEVSEITDQAIKKQIATNRNAAQNIIDKTYSFNNTKNTSSMSLDYRAKKLGYDMQSVNDTAQKYRMTPQQVLTRLETEKK